MLIKDIEHLERPREKALCQGFSNLSDAEVLAILLRTGNRNKNAIELANELIEAAGGLKNFTSNSLNFAKEIKGIGQVKSLTILAAIELAKRINKSPQLINFHQFIERTTLLVKHLFEGKSQEIVAIVGIGQRNKIVLIREVFKGGIDSTVLEPREIFALLLGANARKFILFHNHPSGNPMPSMQDEVMTERIRMLGNNLGIVLEDHVIVADQICYSMMQKIKFSCIDT